MVKTNYLPLSWAVSRGRDTYGYNICRLDDNATDKRYRTMGGGYDMIGTVIGQWLEQNYQERLLALAPQAGSTYGKAAGYETKRDERGNPRSDKFYGMTFYSDKNSIGLDGACGKECMFEIARAIGIRITSNYNRRKQATDGFFVTDFGSNEELKKAEQTES